MAIINCKECNKEISDKAIACPNCGFPLTPVPVEVLKFPKLPSNLGIGKQIVNWGNDAAFKGEYKNEENVVLEIPSGKINVLLFTHGIRIANNYYSRLIDIHNSQIISLKHTTRAELSSVDKSVIGRAVIGGLILGPLGAIVGGMSGIGNTQKIQDTSFLVINYWDVNTKLPQTLLISGGEMDILRFIKRNSNEDKLNQTNNRPAESNKQGCLGFFLLPIGISIAHYLLI